VGVPVNAATVHLYALEDFLVIFASIEHKNKVASLPGINHGGFSLFFRQWTRQSQATQINLRSKIHIAVEGVPPHAWETEVIEDLLGKSCAVYKIAPETSSRHDMRIFKFSAWTSDLDSVSILVRLLCRSRLSQRARRQGPEALQKQSARRRRRVGRQRSRRCSIRCLSM
jgi:hypothetical protein